MRWFSETVRVPFVALGNRIHAFNDALHTRLLYPLNNWLDLHHFVGLALIATGWSYATNPPLTIVKLDDLTPLDVAFSLAIVYIICGVILIARPNLKETSFKLLLLPLYLYAAISAWYVRAGYTDTWAGVITQGMVIGFFFIKSSKPEARSAHDGLPEFNH